MKTIFNAFYLSIFIAALRKIFRQAVPDTSVDISQKYIVAIPYGEHYVCGTFISQDRATQLCQKIVKLTGYRMGSGLTVEQYRHKYRDAQFLSIFECAGKFSMPPDTPEIRKMCQAAGQDLRSTTL